MCKSKEFKKALHELLETYGATIEFDNDSGYDMPAGSMRVYFEDGNGSVLNYGSGCVDSKDLYRHLETEA